MHNPKDREVHVRPRGVYHEVIKPGYRRGLLFDTQEGAIVYAKRVAPLVLVMNRTGKVEHELRMAPSLAQLVADYYEALSDDMRKDGDGHWQISERWSYGRYVGWFVEHDGCRYDGLGKDGEDGPFQSREEAEGCMVEHLESAIAQVRNRAAG